MPEILAASDLLVLPSRWEGMPNVVLEAMAAGKPIVATDVEGVAEALGPQAAEQTVSPGDAEAFADKVVAIADDRIARCPAGQRKSNIVSAKFLVSTRWSAATSGCTRRCWKVADSQQDFFLPVVPVPKSAPWRKVVRSASARSKARREKPT